VTGAGRYWPEQTDDQPSGRQHTDGAGATEEARGPRAADVTGEFRESMSADATGVDGPPSEASPASDSPPPKRPASRSWWIEFPVLLCMALVLALIIKSFVIQAFYIPSSSMENTLDIGDKVLVNKLVYHFRPIGRGDIVVFNGNGSWDPMPTQTEPPQVRLWNAITGLFGTAPGVHDYIKRVIGLPADRVACCDQQGRLTINGVPLNEKPYLYPGNNPSRVHFSVTVPPDRLWVMGDHRDVSFDSREHTQDPGDGTIPASRVVGRAFMIIIPASRWRVLPVPATFQQPRLAGSAAGLGAGAVTAEGVPAGSAGLAASSAPGVPLGLGFAAAMPLTWFQRRMRRRFGRFLRRRFATSVRPRWRGFRRLRSRRLIVARPGSGRLLAHRRRRGLRSGPPLRRSLARRRTLGRKPGTWPRRGGGSRPRVGGHGGSYRGMGL
jgi:signal peptidase I